MTNEVIEINEIEIKGRKQPPYIRDEDGVLWCHVMEVAELLGISRNSVKKTCGVWVAQRDFKVRKNWGSYYKHDDIIDFIDAYLSPMVDAKDKYTITDWVRADEGITRKMAGLIVVEVLVEGIKRGDDVVKMLIDGVAVIDKIRDHNMKFKG
ncbi:hypothetical protein C8R30_101149 [Nitrosomonas nitrosa]|uniref:helix-turn-helix domain-containing protein n=1 Tax=Nitrosomonas nitrosa TaxID=52442 RepID=UPI000D3049F3|nr:helix-turn-helix domain-containing protein [Nitrosomonas nitrosa]PTR04952.1 hypothetical protein C8R30_101149 [Nitrosomonas nitrosa]